MRGGFDADALQAILLEMGVKPTHVRIALDRAALTGEPLSNIMRDFGFLSGEQVAQAISKQTGLRYFSAEEVDQIDPAHIKGLEVGPFRRFVPVGKNEKGAIIVAVPDASVVNEARNQFYPQPTTMVVASEHVIQWAGLEFPWTRFWAKVTPPKECPECEEETLVRMTSSAAAGQRRRRRKRSCAC